MNVPSSKGEWGVNKLNKVWTLIKSELWRAKMLSACVEHMTYRKITANIEVSAQPTYMAGHSKPEEGLYVWAYDIQIANHSHQTVQLLHRFWKITNALGQTLEVRGPGVVGDQPVIRPGESYSYSSFTNLATPSGFMVGAYEMEIEGQGTLTVSVPAFSLDSPEELSLPH